MNSKVVDILCKIIDLYGTKLSISKLEKLMFELCPDSKKEINILTQAYKVQLPKLIEKQNLENYNILNYKDLIRSFTDQTAIEVLTSTWVIDTWILAINKKLMLKTLLFLINECYHEIENDGSMGRYREDIDYVKLKELHERVLKLDPSDINHSHLNLAEIFKSEFKNFELSIYHYELFLKNNPEKIYICFEIANLYHKLRNFDKSISFYNKYIKEYPNFGAAYFNLGLIYKEKEDYNYSIYQFKKSLENDPNEMNQAFYEILKISKLLDKKEYAESYFDNFIENHSDQFNFKTFYTLARIYSSEFSHNKVYEEYYTNTVRDMLTFKEWIYEEENSNNYIFFNSIKEIKNIYENKKEIQFLRIFYEFILKKEFKLALLHFFLAELYKNFPEEYVLAVDQFNLFDYESAKYHYLTSIKIDSNLKRIDMDNFYILKIK